MSNTKFKSVVLLISFFTAMICLGGCSTYTVPGKRADMAVFSGNQNQITAASPNETVPQPAPGEVRVIERKPMAKFPANIVMVRVQEPEYKSSTAAGVGSGRYSVITTRDVEKEEDYDRLGKLLDIAQISPMSRLLLPDKLQSDLELRNAAARLQADIVFIYTIDTGFYNQDNATPLSIISIGLAPTVNVRVTSTVSGLAMDVRSGYIYGTVERTSKDVQLASWFTSKNAFDQLRLKTERKAFEDFLEEFEILWKQISRQYRN